MLPYAAGPRQPDGPATLRCFECGNYISRAAAQQAGRLFVARKEGEQTGRKKAPRKK